MNVARLARAAAAAVAATLLALGAVAGIGARMSHGDGRAQWDVAAGPGTWDVTWGS